MKTIFVGVAWVIASGIAGAQAGGQNGKGAAAPPSKDPVTGWKAALAWLAGSDPIEFDFTVSSAGPRTEYDSVAHKLIDVPWRESQEVHGRFSMRAGGVAFIEVSRTATESPGAATKSDASHGAPTVLYRREDAVAMAARNKQWQRLSRSDFGMETTHGPSESGVSSASRNLLAVVGSDRAGWESASIAKYGVCIQDPRELLRKETPWPLPADFKIDPHQADPPGGLSCKIPSAKARCVITASLGDPSFPPEPGEHSDGFMTVWFDQGGHVESIRVIVQNYIHGGGRAANVARTAKELADPEVAKLTMFETVIWVRQLRKPSDSTLPDEVAKLFTQDLAPAKK